MNKLNALFIIYMTIGISFVPIAALYGNEDSLRPFVLASSGYVSVLLSVVGYALNGGK